MEENMVKSEATEETNASESKEGEKLFTQEQVNEIIRKRLKHQKESSVSTPEMDARAADLTKRENRLNCREYLFDKGYPVELLDIIDTSDVEAFKSKADTASRVYGSKQQEAFVAPLASTEPSMHNNIDSAFKNAKHTPKKCPPRWE